MCEGMGMARTEDGGGVEKHRTDSISREQCGVKSVLGGTYG